MLIITWTIQAASWLLPPQSNVTHHFNNNETSIKLYNWVISVYSTIIELAVSGERDHIRKDDRPLSVLITQRTKTSIFFVFLVIYKRGKLWHHRKASAYNLSWRCAAPRSSACPAWRQSIRGGTSDNIQNMRDWRPTLLTGVIGEESICP